MITRRKWAWTDHRIDQSNKVVDVVNELIDYWPLTLRQIYYRLVAAGHLENTRSKYNDLSKLIKYMRLDDRLPWEVLEDRGRRLSRKRGFTDHQEFFDKDLDFFLEGYARCLVQDQDNYVELWYEKEALARVFEEVAEPFCIRAVACKGYQSITFLDSFRRRAIEAQKQGQTPIILYFGDLDPSGVQMFEATQQTLEEEMGVSDIRYIRIALTPEQAREWELPFDPEAVKLKDTRYKNYVAKYGEVAIELDALHPQKLEDLARGAIEKQFDMTRFHDNETIERAELVKLAGIKEQIKTFVGGMTSQTFS